MNLRILLYWLVVSIPLGWGVAQSVNAALPLFGGKSVYLPWVLGIPPAPAAAPKPTDSAATPGPAAPAPAPDTASGTPGGR